MKQKFFSIKIFELLIEFFIYFNKILFWKTLKKLFEEICTAEQIKT